MTMSAAKFSAGWFEINEVTNLNNCINQLVEQAQNAGYNNSHNWYKLLVELDFTKQQWYIRIDFDHYMSRMTYAYI